MSYIPDCREDENYNEKYLSIKDKVFVNGFDCAVDSILNGVLYNEEVYPALEELLRGEGREIVEEAIEGFAEMARNELITSMIDSMDDDLYNKIKAEVDNENL